MVDGLNRLPKGVRELVGRMQAGGGSVGRVDLKGERPVFGTTLFLASCGVETRFGKFVAHVFQDLVDRHYVMALVFGEIEGAEVLYTRLHSSCLTSETLGGCDCDCVQQLEGAFRTIAEKGRGILFYLMQEGRGAGFLEKARDRMLVQAAHDEVSTFEAYEAFGLKKDHRNYENIGDICHLLGVKASFVVLTNNPDKVQGIKEQGFTIAGTERLEFEPGPFNMAYLTAKAEGGHRLSKPWASRVLPAEVEAPVLPFRPHVVEGAGRFIYAASYFLPMRPVGGEVVLGAEEFEGIFGGKKELLEGKGGAVLGWEKLTDGRVVVRVEAEKLEGVGLGSLLRLPYWFRVHAYYDIAKSQELVVLTYGEVSEGVPVVRLHTESLFNRFPLKVARSKENYRKSVREIVRAGRGVLVLFHDDGRGAGFGAYAVASMMRDRGEAESPEAAYGVLGLGYDSRDHEAAVMLLGQHVKGREIRMLMNSRESLQNNPEYEAALGKGGFEVKEWVFLDEGK